MTPKLHRPISRRVLQCAAAALFAVGLVTATAQPALAVTWYKQSPGGWCGSFYTHSCTVAWTGSWPDGFVRAEGDRGVDGVRLQTRVGCCSGPWITVASVVPNNTNLGITPSVPAGKANYYRACVQPVAGGQWWCNSTAGSVYLGD